MKIEGFEDDDSEALESPFFSSHKELAELEAQLYGHVLRAIDFDELNSLEQHVCMILGDEYELDDDLALDLGKQVMSRALHQVANDHIRRVMDIGAPDGITDEEKAAVAFDDTCPFCAFDRQQAEALAKHAASGQKEEVCECCEMLREEWREQHAAVLKKAGLYKPSGAEALAGAIEIAKRDSRRQRDKPS